MKLKKKKSKHSEGGVSRGVMGKNWAKRILTLVALTLFRSRGICLLADHVDLRGVGGDFNIHMDLVCAISEAVANGYTV